MPLPLKTAFTDAAVTEGGYKTATDAMIDWLTLLFGTVDDYIKLVRGTTVARPAATSEDGWLRYNTDNTELEMTWGSAWNNVVRSSIDATWKWNLESGANVNGLRITGTGASQSFSIADNTTNINLVTDPAKGALNLSGARPFRIAINGVTVFEITSAGAVNATGDITANATIV